MVTTRQTTAMNKGNRYVVDIDFDEASSAWRENKKELQSGMFSYKKSKQNCTHIYENGKKCRKKCTINNEHCECHFT